MDKVDSVNEPSSPRGTEPEAKKDFVQYETYSRVLSQHKRSQAEAEDLKTKLAAYEAKEQERETARLTEEGNYKKLLDNERKARSEEESKRKQYEKQLLDGHKLNALIEKLPGKVKRPEYYSFIDTDKIIIDPTTGQIDELSVEEVKNEFVRDHFSLLAGPTTANLPYNAPGNDNTGKLTHAEWERLPTKEKRKRMKDVTD